jgi:hypothetical protein
MAASAVTSTPLASTDAPPCSPIHCSPKSAEPPAKRRDIKGRREDAAESAFRFPFQQLPPELRLEIYSQLDYRSLISLSQVNNFFHQTVDPQMAHPADKFAFVMHAENFYSQHFPGVVDGQEHPGNFACYICHRVREPGLFDAEQPHSIYLDVPGSSLEDVGANPGTAHDDEKQDEAKLEVAEPKSTAGTATTDEPMHNVQKATAPTSPTTSLKIRQPLEGIRRQIQVTLRRFCIDCGVQKGLHNPGDLLITKLREELWVCDCRKVLQKPGCLKCPDCNSDCPLRTKGKP